MVVDDLPLGSLAVFQQGGVLGQRDHPALKEHFARERLFEMCSIHRFLCLSFPALQGAFSYG